MITPLSSSVIRTSQTAGSPVQKEEIPSLKEEDGLGLHPRKKKKDTVITDASLQKHE